MRERRCGVGGEILEYVFVHVCVVDARYQVRFYMSYNLSCSRLASLSSPRKLPLFFWNASLKKKHPTPINLFYLFMKLLRELAP
jgi:hypothetical protein